MFGYWKRTAKGWQDEYSLAVQQRGDARRERDDAKQERDDEHHRANEATRERDTARDLARQLRSQLSAADLQIAAEKHDNERLKRGLDSLRATNSQLESDRDDARDDWRARGRELDSLAAKLKTAQAGLDHATHCYEQCESLRQGTYDEYNEAKRERDAALATVDSLEEQNREIRIQRENLVAELDRKMADCNRLAWGLTETRNKLGVETRKHEATWQAHGAVHETWRKTIGQRDAAIQERNEAYEVAESRLQRLIDNAGELQSLAKERDVLRAAIAAVVLVFNNLQVLEAAFDGRDLTPEPETTEAASAGTDPADEANPEPRAPGEPGRCVVCQGDGCQWCIGREPREVGGFATIVDTIDDPLYPDGP